MKELIMSQISAIAQIIAEQYSSNPKQAAFIFDRIFLRETKYNLHPERQFNIVKEDCSENAYESVLNIHQYYKSLNQNEKKELLTYAINEFSQKFNQFNINFEEYYAPERKDLPISFDAILGRIDSIETEISQELKITSKKNSTGNQVCTFEGFDLDGAFKHMRQILAQARSEKTEQTENTAPVSQTSSQYVP